MELKYVSKTELHKMIDELPDEDFLVLTYKKDIGISDNGKWLKKKKTKNLVDKATTLVLTETKPVRKVDLEGNFGILPCFDTSNIIKSILIPHYN